jgi:Transposase DDE domain
MIEAIKCKVIEIFDVVSSSINLARKKFMVGFILALIDSKKVQFHEVALAMNTGAKLESRERQIQAFFKDYKFDYLQVCMLLSMFLPVGKLHLSIDRTEWDFGLYQCNILMIVARCGSIGIPLYWELLDNKSGNSSSRDRCKLLTKLMHVIGKERIGLIVGDREFVGLEWVKFLKISGIPFCMRLPKHHTITLKNGNSYTITELLENVEMRAFQACVVDGIECNVLMKRLPDQDYLFLMGSFLPKQLGNIYRNRWCIEVLFQNFKERGFDLESTHLKCDKKIAKMLVFVSLAVAICVKVGEYHHKKVQKIKTKKHGYKANSFCRKGLDILRDGLKNPTQAFVDTWIHWINSFIRLIIAQTARSRRFKKIIG